MSTALSSSPNWTDLLKIKQGASHSQKRKKECVTSEQRDKLLDFILENPEMVTHSSTKENEAALWDDLTKKLNAMLPEKPVTSWQIFWKRWRTNIEIKNESSCTMVDYRLKKFLKNVTANYDNAVQTQSTNKKLTFQDLCNNIKELDAEKTKLKMDIDNLEYTVAIHQTQITELKKVIKQKRKRCRQLSVKRASWNNKKRKIEEKENLN